jgi:hypothetical protein
MVHCGEKAFHLMKWWPSKTACDIPFFENSSRIMKINPQVVENRQRN